ncbi:MAG: GNAT family N-acetyltransferase [Nocardioides sp.]|nr:GNAT family N-acetyltransferase [Nocardioides sp.]
MIDVNFRSAETHDIRAILSFWKRAAEDSNRPTDRTTALERLIQRDSDALLLAEAGDRIVGSIIVGWDGWRCHVYRLAVDPDWRRQGIGRSLLSRAEERFVAFGGTRADAMVLDDNHLAHLAWTAAGYAHQPEWSRWVKPLSLPS